MRYALRFGKGSMRRPFESIRAAVQFWEKYRDDHGIGSRDMVEKLTLEEDGRPIGSVSYNGRVFDLQGKEIQLHP